jgi:hypothetical protein
MLQRQLFLVILTAGCGCYSRWTMLSGRRDLFRSAWKSQEGHKWPRFPRPHCRWAGERSNQAREPMGLDLPPTRSSPPAR